MSTLAPATAAKRIPVFFYGSFIRRDVMARAGFQPEKIEVVRLHGFDIAFCPHACISRSDQHSIYGILVHATHQELDRLYSMSGVGIFLPEAVLVESRLGGLLPAMCYIPPSRGDQPADTEYVGHLIAAARDYGFPDWYVARLGAA
ncbi:hypothetical protein RugamoR64_35200 [Duganella rhizosphaerae]|uniref:gamma-glutamylcyclotransferase family protein n=1 Tax=Duganella rhizosphaerae TaxID=2885763 RepID=UPI0030E92E56